MDRLWRAGIAVVLSGLLVSCGEGGNTDQVDSKSAPARPGWDGYVTPEMRDGLTSAVWNGTEMVMVAFDQADGNFRNVVAAYDPQTGRWRDLPELLTKIPVSFSSVVGSRYGVVAVGAGCDPETSTDDGDGLYCSPGDLRTYIQRPSSDAFVAIEAPERAEDASGTPTLAQGSADGDAYLSMDGMVYRLVDGARWEPSGGRGAGMDLCRVGDALIGVIPGEEQGDGVPALEGLAKLDDGSQSWVPIDLSVEGSFGTLHCGSGASALFQVMNEEPAATAAYLVTATAPPAEIQIPENRLITTITFDEFTFVADAIVFDPKVMPDSAPHQTLLLDQLSGRFVQSAGVLRDQATEVYPLDGELVLAITRSSTLGEESELLYQVVERPKAVS